MATHKLVLVRHGESEWNKLNLFTGWTDVPLSDKGVEEAIAGGKVLKEGNYQFDKCYTSVLKRAIHTAFHVLDGVDQLYIPVEKDYRLNERHYGDLQGLNKKETAEKYGFEQVEAWRRSLDALPPALEEEDHRNPNNQELYKNRPKKDLPLHESLKDSFTRVTSYFNEVIINDIKMGKKVLIVAHGNTLRAIIKYLDIISDEQFIELNIPTGIPIVYELDRKLNPINRYYLGEQEDIENKIELIKNQISIKDKM